MTQLFVLALLVATPFPTLSSVYESARQYDMSRARFRPPDEPRPARMADLVKGIVTALAAGAPPRALVDRAAQSGFELSQAQDDAGELWVLREAGARREGGGLYAFRAAGYPVCIQAPHTFFDAGTGPIALDLFARVRAACLSTNTFHRYAPGSGGGEHPADVAHAPRTLFMAAHEAVVSATPWGIVQVHGFASSDGIGDDVAAIVSDGQKVRPADAPVIRFRDALARGLPGMRVLLYGQDTSTLGATTNLQGQRARSAGRAFIHVELSAASRKHLRSHGASPLAGAVKETFAPR